MNLGTHPTINLAQQTLILWLTVQPLTSRPSELELVITHVLIIHSQAPLSQNIVLFQFHLRG